MHIGILFDFNTYIGIALGAFATFAYFSYTGSTIKFTKDK